MYSGRAAFPSAAAFSARLHVAACDLPEATASAVDLACVLFADQDAQLLVVAVVFNGFNSVGCAVTAAGDVGLVVLRFISRGAVADDGEVVAAASVARV